MTVLLVGADQLGNIPKELEKHGCKDIIHWSGRKKSTVRRNIPGEVDMVIVFPDFVNHSLMGTIKEKAKNLNLPIIFSKRGASNLKERIQNQKINS